MLGSEQLHPPHQKEGRTQRKRAERGPRKKKREKGGPERAGAGGGGDGGNENLPPRGGGGGKGWGGGVRPGWAGGGGQDIWRTVQSGWLKTPWYDHEIPFTQAAELGTRKVITDHSTIGVVVTTDGSFSDLPQETYLDAENQAISELKKPHKPLLVLVNSSHPSGRTARESGRAD